MKCEVPEGMKPAIVVDLDGTIVDMSARLNRALEIVGATEEEVNSREFYRDRRRHSFFNELFNVFAIDELDVPYPDAPRILNDLAKYFTIFYVSSRPKAKGGMDIEAATQKWLNDNGFPDGKLILRPEFQRANAFFISTYSGIEESGYKICFAIDDLYNGRESYEALGIPIIEIIDGKIELPQICLKMDGNEFCLSV